MYVSLKQIYFEKRSGHPPLTDYRVFKDLPGLENYLLDCTDFYDASLKFKLRSNTLPLERRICNWSTENNDGNCTLCKYGIEDVSHFLFICDALKSVRIDEYKKLEDCLVLNNCYDAWDLFISSDLNVKLCLTLSDMSCIYKNMNNAEDIYSIFDQFCKSYTKRAWKLRSNLKAQSDVDLS